MKYKRFILLLVCLFIAFELYSRAGGGSSGGGGGGGFSGGGGGYYYHYGHYGYGSSQPLTPGGKLAIFIVHVVGLFFIGVAFFGFSFLLWKQIRKSKRQLKESAKHDKLWNEQNMIEFTKETFIQIQNAWTQRDLSVAGDLVTHKLIQKYQPLLNHYKKKHIVNVMTNITFIKVAIVKAHDSVRDEEDSYTAYIKGKMNDYFTSEYNFTSTISNGDDPEEFEDVYIFTRKGNQWQLNDIVNDPDKKDIR